MTRFSAGAHRRIAAMAVANAAIFLGLCGTGWPADATSLPGMTYESLAQLPDLSGWWREATGATMFFAAVTRKDLLSSSARKALDIAISGANLPTGGTKCWPSHFIGDNGGGLEDAEFVLSPGRLTITNESGLLRRIYFDGRALPAEPDESRGGTSVARWEGRTLHIETVGLMSVAGYPGQDPQFPRLGAGAHVSEVLSVNDKAQIVINTVLTAPAILKQPLEFTSVYEREPNHVERDHDTCGYDRDRTIDSKTGLQRFDLTPPADLPPPPND